MERLTDLLFEVWDENMFQMVQGIILGLMIAVGITLTVMGFKREKMPHTSDTEDAQKEEEDDEH